MRRPHDQQSYTISPEGEPGRILANAKDLPMAFEIARQHEGVPILIVGMNWVNHKGRRARKCWVLANDGTDAVRQDWV